jgi:TonB family protein
MRSHRDRVEAFTALLIRLAARAVPAELAERLEEEWLADLASRRNALARLRLALGCLWASQVIAHDFLATRVAAGTAAAGQRTVVALDPQGFSPFSPRGVVLLVIIGIHGALIYAFASGFAIEVINRVTQPIIAVRLPPDLKPHPDPLPALDHALINKNPVVPELDVPTPVDMEPTITTSPVVEGGNVGVGNVPTGGTGMTVDRRIGGPGTGFPNTDDYYPDSAIRQREEGVAAVQVCVNDKGKLNANPTLLQSSGYAQLDEGALKLAKAGSGHYRSTTEDGRAVGDCFAFRVRYKLKQ